MWFGIKINLQKLVSSLQFGISNNLFAYLVENRVKKGDLCFWLVSSRAEFGGGSHLGAARGVTCQLDMEASPSSWKTSL